MAVGSTDEDRPGQRVAGQEDASGSAEVLPGQEDAGQGTALETELATGEETGCDQGEGGSNELHGDGMKKLAVLKAQKSHEQLLAKGLLMRIYWKVADGRIPVEQKDCPKGSNKMDRNLVISVSTDRASEQELSLALVDNAGPSMEDGTALLPVYDPQRLIQSATTDWVTRRGLTDRTIWPAIAASARNICAEMIQVDEMNFRLETGKLLCQRRDQGHHGDLHHPFHDDPCLPAVGNYPLSVMGALLSPGLENEFRNCNGSNSLRLEPYSRHGSSC